MPITEGMTNSISSRTDSISAGTGSISAGTDSISAGTDSISAGTISIINTRSDSNIMPGGSRPDQFMLEGSC